MTDAFRNDGKPRRGPSYITNPRQALTAFKGVSGVNTTANPPIGMAKPFAQHFVDPAPSPAPLPVSVLKPPTP